MSSSEAVPAAAISPPLEGMENPLNVPEDIYAVPAATSMFSAMNPLSIYAVPPAAITIVPPELVISRTTPPEVTKREAPDTVLRCPRGSVFEETVIDPPFLTAIWGILRWKKVSISISQELQRKSSGSLSVPVPAQQGRLVGLNSDPSISKGVGGSLGYLQSKALISAAQSRRCQSCISLHNEFLSGP